MKYDVSVVIPFFNNESYLEEAVISVLNQQTKDLKIEILLINDCSTDNSLGIAKKFLNYENIILIDKRKNEGVSAARNDGIKKASGKYIMLLDGDDYIIEGTISSLVTFFDEVYDKVDLVTYPLYMKRDLNAPQLNPKYKNYDKGTGIYYLEEYPYLNQTTINVIFKNNKESFFDQEMKLAEDQKFITSIIMLKRAIGYCDKGKYIYRRYGGGVSEIYNNFYYCYEDIIKFNEWLINFYREKSTKKIPRYIQGMILNTLNWRLNKDMLLPYHLEEEYDMAVSRIFNLLKFIDVDFIYNYPNMSLNNKIYFLQKKDIKLDLKFSDEKVNLIADNIILEKFNLFTLNVKRNKVIGNTMHFRATFNECFLCLKKPEVFLVIKRNNLIERIELKLFKIVDSQTKEISLYNFEVSIDLSDVESFRFELVLFNKKFDIECKHFKFSSAKKISKNYIVNYRKNFNGYFVKKANIKNRLRYWVAMLLKSKKKERQILLYKFLSRIVPYKNIWLYYDFNTAGNGYLQFIYDINKKDGIKRYYVYSKRNKDTLDKKYHNNLIEFNSIYHKLFFLKTNTVFTSEIYCGSYIPFQDISKIKDVLNYKLIYLPQHIINANLSKFDYKENNEVDKIVVSSNYERKNYVKNYGYNDEDLIPVGVPKYDIIDKTKIIKNKILLEFSFRGYLSKDKKINVDFFEKTNFYLNIVNLLENETFLKILDNNNIYLDIKMDVEFQRYSNSFKFHNEKIKIKYDDVKLSEYKLLITDFCPSQFDFIKFNRPIIYFIPDFYEVKAGLHTFRKIDMNESQKFGDTYVQISQLVERIKYIINNNYKVDNKYKKNMQNFFLFDKGKCRKKIYNLIKY